MADKKITQLVDGGVPQATDEFVIARAGDNFKVDFASLDQATLDQAVILAPAASTRNVIQPTAGAVIAAIVKAHAAQSVDLMQWQTSAGTMLGSVGLSGGFRIDPSADVDGIKIVPFADTGAALGTGIRIRNAADSATRISFHPSGQVFVESGDPTTSAFFGKASTGQVDPILVLTDDAYGNLFEVSPSGRVIAVGGAYFAYQWWVTSDGYEVLKHIAAAPADGVIQAGELFAWFEATNGAPKHRRKGKTLDGTVFEIVPYVVGGTDVALADGGTGASLVDPGADRIMFWDDSAGVVTWLTAGTNLTITGTTLDATGGGGAPTTATYITQTADAGLSAEQALSALATGLVKNTTATGVLSIGAQGTDYYAPGGTDVAVADGGTGSSTAAGARTSLGAAPSGLTRRVRVRMDTPDSLGNGYPALSTSNGFSNVRRIVPAFTKDVVGSWEGSVEIPADYASGGAIVCSYVCNATTGVYTNQISTAVVADGVTEDTAYTAETAVDTTVPGTAKLRKDVSTTLTTTPVAGSTLNVKVAHNGTAANDTLAVDMLLWECHFSYVSV